MYTEVDKFACVCHLNRHTLKIKRFHCAICATVPKIRTKDEQGQYRTCKIRIFKT